MIPGLKTIDDTIAEAFGVTIDEMKDPGRKRPGTEARQFGMWYRKKYARESPSIIGKHYNRDHATVLYASKIVDTLIDSDKGFREKAENALKALNKLK